MAKTKNIEVDEKFQKKSEEFIENMNSDMRFKSEFIGDDMLFDWVKEIEFACPYIDNIIRNPKLTLVNEEDVVKIEKAKKISVTSVKDLSKHTHYIEKIDEKTNEVSPSKILIERREETFNTYENRFIYTLIDNMLRFVMDKERTLEELESKSSKKLEYYATSETKEEKINIEVKLNANELPKDKTESDFQKEIEDIKKRVKNIKDYIGDWRRSEFVTSLDKAHVAFIIPPVRKTNMILKNPNFQIASKLWQYLLNYDLKNEAPSNKSGLETSGDNLLQNILNDTFLTHFYIMDSISKTKKEQKEKLKEYGLLMIVNQIKRTIEMLRSSGYDITEDEILKRIADEMEQEKVKQTAGVSEIEKKFREAMEDFLKESKEGLK